MFGRIQAGLFRLMAVTSVMCIVLHIYLETRTTNRPRAITAGIHQEITNTSSMTDKLNNTAHVQDYYVMMNQSDRYTSDTTGRETVVAPFVIVAYYRSGSSLTGDVLQHDPRTFYVYEPMHALENMLNNNRTQIRTMEGKILPISRETFYERAVNVTAAYFKCDFRILDLNTVSHLFNIFSHRHNKYLTCVQNNETTRGRYTASSVCLPLLTKACLESNFRYLKVMRVPMRYFMDLMYKYKDMKIIHVVRDPRATFYSWSTLGVDMFSNVKQSALEICNYILREIQTFERFQKLYPGRVKRLYYEDLARNPVESFRELYNYIGLKFTDAISYHIHYITSMGKKDDCSICVLRGNSSFHISKWQRHLTETQVGIIDRVCSPMYNKTGYIAIRDQKLKD